MLLSNHNGTNNPTNKYVQQLCITAEQTRFFKLGIDMDNNQSPCEKYLAKQDISALIADPIDREVELRCDWIDGWKECAQHATRCLCPPFCVSLAEVSIVAQAERQKQLILQEAENARFYRDVYSVLLRYSY